MRFKKKLRIILPVAAAALIISLVFVSIRFYIKSAAKDELSKKILSGEPVKAAFLLYGTEKLRPESLDVFLIYYERKTSLLKIVSVNSDMVFFDKRKIAHSLKKTFFSDAQKDMSLAVKNFYSNLFQSSGITFEPDIYINLDYEILLNAFEAAPGMKSLILDSGFKNRDLQCLNQLEIFQVLTGLLNNNALSNIARLNKYYSSSGAVVSKPAILNLILFFRFNNAKIMFCDLPAKYGKKRIEPDKENIEQFFSKVYYNITDIKNTELAGQIEVKNASGKARMAEKAAWLLRDARFDVLDWSNFHLSYEKTIIKDYKGNFGAALKAAEVLKSGNVIVSYNLQNSCALSAFIGKDCQIYDKLDKKSQ